MGRIVCDSEGHLNASSVLLEGTLQHSQGHSVKLDLSQLPSYRLFPGQVCCSDALFCFCGDTVSDGVPMLEGPWSACW